MTRNIIPKRHAERVFTYDSKRNYDRVWWWRRWLPERKDQLCGVQARGTMNAAMVEFAVGTFSRVGTQFGNSDTMDRRIILLRLLVDAEQRLAEAQAFAAEVFHDSDEERKVITQLDALRTALAVIEKLLNKPDEGK